MHYLVAGFAEEDDGKRAGVVLVVRVEHPRFLAAAAADGAALRARQSPHVNRPGHTAAALALRPFIGGPARRRGQRDRRGAARAGHRDGPGAGARVRLIGLEQAGRFRPSPAKLPAPPVAAFAAQ